MATRKTEDHERLIDRDLTALAREGKLPAAHGVDGAVSEVLGLLTRGGKHPLLAGIGHSTRIACGLARASSFNPA